MEKAYEEEARAAEKLDAKLALELRWLERGVRDVPHPGERIAAGRPICTVVATAETPRDALAALEEQAARLRAELDERVEVAAGG